MAEQQYSPLQLGYGSGIDPECFSGFGRAIVLGLLGVEEVLEIVLKVGECTQQQSLNRAHAITDAVRIWHIKRDRTEALIARQVSELMDGPRSADLPQRILRAAYNANRAAGEPLVAGEIRAILDSQAHWWAIRQRKGTKAR